MNRPLLLRWMRLAFTAADRPTPRPSIRPTLERLEDRLTPSFGFASQAAFAVGGGPVSVATADFNVDKLPDIVTANSGDGTVSVLLNTTPTGATAPTFAGQVTFAVGADPVAVAVGDFNGDGKPDIVVANGNNGTVSELLNTTPVGATVPSFAAPVTFAVGANPKSVAVGDFNGDDKPDIVVANYNDNTVSVLLNTTPTGAATPSFAPQETFSVGNDPDSVAVGDFNGDGTTDLAVANELDDTVSVLLNTTPTAATTASFAPQQTFAVGQNPVSVAVGDFNGDGRLDLVVANAGNITYNLFGAPMSTANVSVLLNATQAGATTASFAPQQTFYGGVPDSVAVGDFDGDGRPDIVAANSVYLFFKYVMPDDTVSVLLNTTGAGATTASFAPQQTFALDGYPNSADSVAVADFNGDGRPDIVAANSNGTVSVLLNTTPAGSATFPAVVADVPGQGVEEYDRDAGAWVQLNAQNPSEVSLLAADPRGDVFADYPGYGVYRYSPSTFAWTLLNGHDAVALTADAQGDAFPSIAGAGVGEFRLNGTAQLLNTSAAALLAADANGNLIGDFTGYGVYRYTASTGAWTLLNGNDAEAVAVDARGDAFLSIAGAGLGEFRADGTTLLITPFAPSALDADGAGDLAADFTGYGVQRYTASSGGWTPLNGHDAVALAIDATDAVFASFAGAGVAEFQSDGAAGPVNAATASLLAADPFEPPI